DRRRTVARDGADGDVYVQGSVLIIPHGIWKYDRNRNVLHRDDCRARCNRSASAECGRMELTARGHRRRLQWLYGIPAMLWLMVAGLPFYFMVQSGFKKQFDLLSNPFWKLPREWTLGNYRTVLEGTFLRSLLNSVFVVSVSVTLILL